MNFEKPPDFFCSDCEDFASSELRFEAMPDEATAKGDFCVEARSPAEKLFDWRSGGRAVAMVGERVWRGAGSCGEGGLRWVVVVVVVVDCRRRLIISRVSMMKT